MIICLSHLPQNINLSSSWTRHISDVSLNSLCYIPIPYPKRVQVISRKVQKKKQISAIMYARPKDLVTVRQNQFYNSHPEIKHEFFLSCEALNTRLP